MTGNITKEEYYDFCNAYPKHDYSFPADYKVSQYIKANTERSDTIYSLGGIESVIYFLTQRESPSRFIFSWIFCPILTAGWNRLRYTEMNYWPTWRQKTPKYIVSVRSVESFKQFADIYHFITDNYVLDKVFPMTDMCTFAINTGLGRYRQFADSQVSLSG